MLEQVLQAVLQVVIPVFLVAGLGFVYAGRYKFPVAGITDLIINMTAACLVFDALSSAEPFALSAVRAPLSAAAVIAGGIVIGLLAHRFIPGLRSLPRGAVVLPAAFMNAGNLGLPLMHLAYGDPGLQVAMLFFVTFAAMQYSLGIAIVKGRGGLGEVLRVPLVYAAILGIVFNQTRWPLPKAVSVPIGMLAATVIPLMLLSLGARMRALVLNQSGPRPALAPVFILPLLRMVGGLGLGFLVNFAFGNEGLVAKVTIVVSMLPPAVMNFALVEKYGEDERAPAIVSGAIAVGTMMALVMLPLGLALLGPLD